jgi:uncharacterized membrane protein YraQ (UPF0718 family)
MGKNREITHQYQRREKPISRDEVGVIPLVEAMLLKGVAVGTTLAFMMSIAAISLPE